jgi:hypothetical protein
MIPLLYYNREKTFERLDRESFKDFSEAVWLPAKENTLLFLFKSQ